MPGNTMPEVCHYAALATAALTAGADAVLVGVHRASNPPDTGFATLLLPTVFVELDSLVGQRLSELARSPQTGSSVVAVLSDLSVTDGNGDSDNRKSKTQVHLALLLASSLALAVVLVCLSCVIQKQKRRDRALVRPLPTVSVEGASFEDGARGAVVLENDEEIAFAQDLEDALRSSHRLSLQEDLQRQSPSRRFSSTSALKKLDPGAIPDQDICAVCIEPFEQGCDVRCLRCGHIFHKDCIDPWLLDHGTCPLCKVMILPDAGIFDESDGGEGTGQLSTQFLDSALLAMEQLFVWHPHGSNTENALEGRSGRPVLAPNAQHEHFNRLLNEAENWLLVQDHERHQLVDTRPQTAPEILPASSMNSIHREVPFASTWNAAPDVSTDGVVLDDHGAVEFDEEESNRSRRVQRGGFARQAARPGYS